MRRLIAIGATAAVCTFAIGNYVMLRRYESFSIWRPDVRRSLIYVGKAGPGERR